MANTNENANKENKKWVKLMYKKLMIILVINVNDWIIIY